MSVDQNEIFYLTSQTEDMSDKPAETSTYCFLAQVTTGKEWSVLGASEATRPSAMKIRMDRISRTTTQKTLLRNLKELVY